MLLKKKNKSGARNMWDLRGRSPSLRPHFVASYPPSGGHPRNAPNRGFYEKIIFSSIYKHLYCVFCLCLKHGQCKCRQRRNFGYENRDSNYKRLRKPQTYCNTGRQFFCHRLLQSFEKEPCHNQNERLQQF